MIDHSLCTVSVHPRMVLLLQNVSALLTHGGVPDKRLFILEHRVNGQLLAVLGCDDGDGGLLVGGDRRHLLDHLDLCVLVVDARERVELHRLDEAAILQSHQDE